jgi:hypothetical protein
MKSITLFRDNLILHCAIVDCLPINVIWYYILQICKMCAQLFSSASNVLEKKIVGKKS